MISKLWLLHHDRFIHSIKTALAVLIGFVITKSMHLPVDQWLVITIIVVMCAQINVGSMLQKSYMRFLGTLTGSLIAITSLTLFGNNLYITGIIILLASIFFTYLATSQRSYHESGTLGAVTVVIILLGEHPSLNMALGRFFEISLGIFIAAIISQFVLPIHARYYLRHNQAKTLRQLRAYYTTTLLNEQDKSDYLTIDENVVKSLIAQRKLALDASHEPLNEVHHTETFNQSLLCEREILRSITFMYHAYLASPKIKEILHSLPSVELFNKSACKTLDNMADVLATKKSAMEMTFPDIASMREAIFEADKSLQPDEIVYADSFLFSAEVLVNRMKELAKLVSTLKIT